MKERKEQVKGFITSKLGKNERRIYARKCQIISDDKQEAKDFLDKYHILGKVNFIEAFGLSYKGELVSLITIGNHHRTGDELVLNRYITKHNTTVVGGLSRLCKAAKDKYGPIATWIDRRWSTGSSWEKCGWKVIRISDPDYFYFRPKDGKVFSKQSRRKSIANTPKGMTEAEHAEIDGLKKVFDCGKIKLIYT